MKPCTVEDNTPQKPLDITVTLHVTTKDELFYLRELFNFNPSYIDREGDSEGFVFKPEAVGEFSYATWEAVRDACEIYR